MKANDSRKVVVWRSNGFDPPATNPGRRRPRTYVDRSVRVCAGLSCFASLQFLIGEPGSSDRRLMLNVLTESARSRGVSFRIARFLPEETDQLTGCANI